MKNSTFTRRDFLRGICAGAFAGMIPSMARGGAKADKPNVVVILTDDQGWGDLSVHGNSNLHTPNVDSL